MSKTVSERGWNIRYGMRTVTYEIDGPLCGQECNGLDNSVDLCNRHYPEELYPLEIDADGRHKRCDACIEGFGLDGDKETS